MAQKLTDEQLRAFVPHGTRTGALSTVRTDGSPRAAPVRFLPDGDDVVYNTAKETAKRSQSGP